MSATGSPRTVNVTRSPARTASSTRVVSFRSSLTPTFTCYTVALRPANRRRPHRAPRREPELTTSPRGLRCRYRCPAHAACGRPPHMWAVDISFPRERGARLALVLKPLDVSVEDLDWQAAVLAAVDGARDARVPPPIRSASGCLVVEGWTACWYEPGTPPAARRTGRSSRLVAFSRQLAGRPRPAFLDRRCSQPRTRRTSMSRWSGRSAHAESAVSA